MPYKIMVIDDAQSRREKKYTTALNSPAFEPLFIWTRSDFDKHKDEPMDGYIVDMFLDEGDWKNTNAAELIKESILTAPRPAPVFLISKFWGDERVLKILKEIGDLSAKVVQYLAWSEFEQATAQNENAVNRLEALHKKLIYELNLWHGRSGFRPEPDQTIRILLLADVQFGDPKTDPKATFSENIIAAVLKRQKSLPDLIVIAGDISFSGRPDEFALAEERLTNDLIGPLWGTHNIDDRRDRIVIVPGNHDVNLRFSHCDHFKYDPDTQKTKKEDIPSWRDELSAKSLHQDYALQPFCHFANKHTLDRNFTNPNNILTWVDRRFIHCGIRFFILNSVPALNSTQPRYASFSEPAIRNIFRSLGKQDGESVFNIAVSHHGLRQEGVDAAKEQINNWKEVGEPLFTNCEIKLWLFGHYHEFDTRSINSKPFQDSPLWMLQAPTSRISSANRGFCIIELTRQDGRVVDAHVQHHILDHSMAKQGERRRIFDKG